LTSGCTDDGGASEEDAVVGTHYTAVKDGASSGGTDTAVVDVIQFTYGTNVTN